MKLNTFVAMVGSFVILPIWYYLLYTLLCAAHVDRLVWFLFWVYVPLGTIFTLVSKALEDNKR